MQSTVTLLILPSEWELKKNQESLFGRDTFSDPVAD
jgi:hypothetical protein